MIELKAVVSILCLLGASKKNENVRNLWGDGPLSRPAFKATKSVNRLGSIRCYLRFGAMNTREKRARDKFSHLRNMNVFREKMQIKLQIISKCLHRQKTHSNLWSLPILSIPVIKTRYVEHKTVPS